MSGIDGVRSGGVFEAPPAQPDTPAPAPDAAGAAPDAAAPGAPDRGDVMASFSASQLAEATETTDPWGRTIRHSVDPEGSHQEVRATAPDGRALEARTSVRSDGVRSEVSVTSPDGTSERWLLEDSFEEGRADIAVARRFDADGNEVEAREVTPREFVAFAGRTFAVDTDGVEFKDPLEMTYASEFTSASMLVSGEGPDGADVHVVAALGVHGAFPFPGSHWDAGQLAILDGDYQPTLTLRMPKDMEAAHTDVRFEDGVDEATGQPTKTITYQGYMEDDAGELHFVEARFDLASREIEKEDPGLRDRITGWLNERVGFDQNPKVLSELRGRTPSTLLVDGKKVLDVKKTLGALDDGARMNFLVNHPRAALNPAPPDAPIVSLIDPEEEEVRYRFDSTVLEDTSGLVARLLPRALREGTLRAHYVSDAEGRRRDVTDELTPDGPPLSEKTYVWEMDGEPVATIHRELMRFKDAEGHIELGFRETIRKIGDDR